MKKILFADLDDTLFQSHRKMSPAQDWRPLAYLSDGSAISYANPQQQAMLELFMREMTVIPVTARSHDAYRRVDIPFKAEAIINYGGIILDADGHPDPVWQAASAAKAEACQTDLQRWTDALSAECERLGLDLRIRLIRDFDIPFYVVAKSSSGNDAAVAAGAEFCLREREAGRLPDLYIHINSNNLALIPRWLDKRHAVDNLRQRYAEAGHQVISFGMGDSLVDLNFIGACDYMIVPAASQIAAHRLRGES